MPPADSIPAVMAVSTLDIVNVTAADAGIYTCAPSNARNHSVVVHVVKGKKGERKNEWKRFCRWGKVCVEAAIIKGLTGSFN